MIAGPVWVGVEDDELEVDVTEVLLALVELVVIGTLEELDCDETDVDEL